jgi:hypothetical protein
MLRWVKFKFKMKGEMIMYYTQKIMENFFNSGSSVISN